MNYSGAKRGPKPKNPPKFSPDYKPTPKPKEWYYNSIEAYEKRMWGAIFDSNAKHIISLMIECQPYFFDLLDTHTQIQAESQLTKKERR